MSQRSGTAIWVVVLLVTLMPARAQVQVSGTPASRALQAWLKSFNSNDPSEISAFHQRFDPRNATGFMTPMRKQTGGFNLTAVERADPRVVTFVVRERRPNGNLARGTLRLHDSESESIASFELFVISDRPPADESVMDHVARARVIDAVATRLRESYVFADVASHMTDVLKQNAALSKYDPITAPQAFADVLTTDLRAVSNDRHLQVRFANVPPVKSRPNGAAANDARQLQILDCGFEKVERLPTNIGYVKLNVFADARFCAPQATAAMQLIANTDAVIFDLRDNGGGIPEMVAYLSSYLFPEPVHLNDLWTRAANTTKQYWTLSYVSGERLTDQPVYVLTSSKTFSAAEEFAYNLQALKRASIVGEVTAGGAHPVAGFPLPDRFMITVPIARAVNPITGKNWEGTGVQPDVRCSAADALTTAERLALTRRARLQ